jgi:hypothetical protein
MTIDQAWDNLDSLYRNMILAHLYHTIADELRACYECDPIDEPCPLHRRLLDFKQALEDKDAI